MAMDQYYLDLSAIKNVISNWDPVKKILVNINHTADIDYR